MTVYRASMLRHRRTRTLLPLDLAEPLLTDLLRELVAPLGEGHCLEVRAGDFKLQWIHRAVGSPALLMFCTPIPPRVLRAATSAQRAELVTRGFSMIGNTAFLATHEIPVPTGDGIAQLARSGLAILRLAYGLDPRTEVSVSMRDARPSLAQKIAFVATLVATAGPALFWTITASGPASRLIAIQSGVFHDGRYSPKLTFALLFLMMLLGFVTLALPTQWMIERSRTVRE